MDRARAETGWRFCLLAALLMPLLLVSDWAMAQGRQFFIGTGSPLGVYFATGEAICQLVNRDKQRQDALCRAEPAGGATANIDALRNGELQFGITQSDIHYQALKGIGRYRDAGAFSELRSVFSLYTEVFTVLAREGSQVARFEDFKGKRFNIGHPDTGTRASLEELLGAAGMRVRDFALATELRVGEQGQALCGNAVDGIFFGVGHPSASILEPAKNCGAKLIPLTGAAVDKLLAQKPYYFRTTIPGGLYPGNGSIESYGVVASLIATRRTSADLVYRLVKAMFEHLEDFKGRHPALTHLDAKDMVQRANFAPLHEGAERYFREKGLL
ncbi:TAXI family TRAP transporter solute-binding subunit [Ferrovibrio sp.]|uniref:TAXI family TRAP transporter solute-binding subunit n=1 Tax=Ferrovibrio sp. TaxID=1917215 RepID=UPI003D2BE958